MLKTEGSWTRIGLTTIVPCLALGLLFGYAGSHSFSQEENYFYNAVETVGAVALELAGVAAVFLFDRWLIRWLNRWCGWLILLFWPIGVIQVLCCSWLPLWLLSGKQ